jgi:hypothetical protein
VTVPKIPLNLFGIPFGLAGLGEVWPVLAFPACGSARPGDH